MSFEGGGFRALSVYVGITAGLLGANGARLGDKDGIFSRAANIASNSGGSWFSSMLIYSQGFLDKINKIAEDPKGNELYWYESFLEPFLESLGADFTAVKPIQSADLHNPSNSMFKVDLSSVLDILLELGFAVGMTTNWEGLVKKLFEASPAEPGLQLGSPVNTWAEGKIWRAALSIPTLGGEGVGTCAQNPTAILCLGGGGKAVTIRNNHSKYLNYRVNAGKDARKVPNFLPAGISVRLGDGLISRSPHRFTTPRFRDMFFEYADKGSTDEVITAQSPPVGIWSAYEYEVGKFPISAVIGASSAFLGGLVMINTLNAGQVQEALHKISEFLKTLIPSLSGAFDQLDTWLYNLANTDWSLWGSNKADGTALHTGREWHNQAVQDGGFLNKQQFKEMAGQGLFSMVDGAYTDNTAIATAVAQGATEVTVFLNSDDLYGLFKGAPDVYQPVDILDVNFCPFCTIGFQVFSNDTNHIKDLFQKQSTNFKVVGSSSIVQSIKIFSFDVETQDNLWFKIKRGQMVRLNIVQVMSSLGLGGYGYKDYSLLVSEVAQSLMLPENKDHTNTIWSWVKK